MKKNNRLTKNSDFQKIINNKQSVASANFIIYYQANNLSNSRIGISSSKKLGNAVKRNKYRRQLRSMIDELEEYIVNIDYVVIIRINYTQGKYSEKLEDLKNLLQKIQRRL